MEEIDIKEIFDMFWSRRTNIIIIILIFAILGIIYTMELTTPIYTSSTTLLLVSTNSSENNTVTVGDISINSKLVPTYSRLIKSGTVINQVASNLEMPINSGDITVTQVKGTELIKIEVKNKNAQNSAKIANEIAKVFNQKINELYNINNVQVIDEAQVENTPSNINHIKDVVMFVVVGIIIASGYVFLANMLDLTVKETDDFEKAYNLPILASTPIYGEQGKNKNKGRNRKKKNELVVHNNPKSPISEVFRTLRTNIQFMNQKDKLRAILVTSTMPKEGKSWISSNLAVTFAQAGKKVILVDGDMRKGRQSGIFNVAPKPGLSNYLSNFKEEDKKLKLEDYIQLTKIEGLYVISAGSIPPNPSELLVSERMLELVEKLKDMCDMVILDGPPTGLVTDAVIISRIVDCTVIVTANRQTKRENLNKIINNIKNVGGKIAGIVLNRVEYTNKKYKETYYYGEENKK